MPVSPKVHNPDGFADPTLSELLG